MGEASLNYPASVYHTNIGTTSHTHTHTRVSAVWVIQCEKASHLKVWSAEWGSYWDMWSPMQIVCKIDANTCSSAAPQEEHARQQDSFCLRLCVLSVRLIWCACQSFFPWYMVFLPELWKTGGEARRSGISEEQEPRLCPLDGRNWNLQEPALTAPK